MLKKQLLDIFDETEDIYLDGVLNSHELPEPENQILYDFHELKDMRKHVHNKWINEKTNQNMNVLIEKGDTINYILDKNLEGALVLNFANPHIPGGGVRRGAKAQEEDLCRASNLLYALESRDVKAYYKNGRNYDSIGSGNAILSKNISIVRRTNAELLDRPVIVDVLTVAAPIVTEHTKKNDLYYERLERRIENILTAAEYYGYKTLVLGAWGCGAFKNDPKDIARIFNLKLSTGKYNFESVYFVIKADSDRGMNNFNCFYDEFRSGHDK